MTIMLAIIDDHCLYQRSTNYGPWFVVMQLIFVSIVLLKQRHVFIYVSFIVSFVL